MDAPEKEAQLSDCIPLNMESFEDTYLKNAFFMGEHKLDRALLSLLHLIDDKSSKIEEYKGRSFLIQKRRFVLKTSKHPNKSVRHRYKREFSDDENFSYVKFSYRYGIPLDTINGIYPLNFKNSRLVFHSLKISYALFLTMKMFKVDKVKSNQRIRNRMIFLKKENLLSSIFLQIYSNFRKKNLDEKSLIKCLKNSLCLMVSKAMEQDEVPEGDSIELFPPEIWKGIQRILPPDSLVTFCFSCLQSKSLCQEVPEEFILETLIKHRDQLSKPHRGLDDLTLSQLRETGREFGVHVAKYYKANEGFFPTNKATFQFPRHSGGVKGDLVFNNRLCDLPNREDPNDRMEPFVIGLFGQPGQGKSTRLKKIVSELSILFPGVTAENLTFERTCHVEHWDGYTGQPIVIFDDLGQSQDGHDIREFQTLVSCCPYTVPMADLPLKGTMFNSPIVIATSNLKYGSRLRFVYDNNPIIDDASFWRRFHFPILVEDNSLYQLRSHPRWIRDENLYFPRSNLGNILKRDVKTQGRNMVENKYFQRKTDFSDQGDQNKWIPLIEDYSFARNLYKLRRKYHENFRQKWIQTVVDTCQDTSVLDPLLEDIEEFGFTESLSPKVGTGTTKCLTFPAYPPVGPLPVRVEPVPEPLKVRTITAGKGDTFCLKPLQRAMWLALGDYPQFCLTHGTNRLETAIQRLFEQSSEGDVWISGDYSAATDSFSIEGSRALLEGILESIDHEPTKRWAMKEISPHLLVYPQNSGLTPVLQKSGQLMGSLLSFPLLCLLNDCTAKFSGLTPDQYLINGDDILMRTGPETYPVWKEKVANFGLDLSAGKNYIHPRYGTVNSQLIVDGNVVGSGKQNVLDRRSRVLGECLRDLELAMPETEAIEVQELFKSVNRMKLNQTVRSISVPISHGGLSLSWGKTLEDKRSQRTAKLCYLNDLFRKIKPLKDCIAIPYLSNREKNVSDLKEMERTFNEPVNEKEYHEDFLSPIDINLVSSRCLKHQHLRSILLDQPLETMPSLSFLHVYQIPCTDHKIKKNLQKAIDDQFLMNFLQGGQDFSYDTFRREFLATTMNLKDISEKTVLHLVRLIDLDVQPDFLDYMNLNFDPTAFDPEIFSKSLGKALRPKEFNLPDVSEDFFDFSHQIEADFLLFATANGLDLTSLDDREDCC